MGFFKKLTKKINLKGVGKLAKKAIPKFIKSQKSKPAKTGGLFGKKEGGTDTGNFIRAIADQATNGLLGQGNNLIPKSGENLTESQIKRNETVKQVGSVVGSYLSEKAGNLVKDEVEKVKSGNGSSLVKEVAEAGVDLGIFTAKEKLIQYAKKYWYVVLPLSILAVWGLIKLFRNVFTKNKRARR